MSAVIQIHDQDRKQSIGFKQILVATDFSDASQKAFDYAIAIARHYGSELSVVHSLPSEPRSPVPIYPLPPELDRDRLEAEEAMKALGERARTHNLNARLLLKQGSVWEVLAAVTQQHNVDLLVLGTSGRSGLKKLALGSVAEEALRMASCPVLTIGPNVQAADSAAIEFRRILFATDFGPTAAKAFPYALSLAEEYRAKLVLLHMVPPMPVADLGPSVYCPPAFGADALTKWQNNEREESVKKLRELIPANTKLAYAPECLVGMDFLPEGILNIAATHKIDLIVMGANRTPSPRVAAHIPWTLTHAVLSHATCPVLTVSNREWA